MDFNDLPAEVQEQFSEMDYEQDVSAGLFEVGSGPPGTARHRPQKPLYHSSQRSGWPPSHHTMAQPTVEPHSPPASSSQTSPMFSPTHKLLR
jgi:hypothetical protein